MLAVQVAVDTGQAGPDVAQAEAALAELEPVNQAWLQRHWRDYTGKSTPARNVPLALAVLPGTEPAQVELWVDETLFQQLAMLYALWGWPVLEDAQAQVAALSPPQPALAGLVRGACGLLRARIATELAAVEAEVGVLAKARWQATRRQLQAWQGGFRPVSTSHYVFTDRQAWTQANARLDAFHALGRKRRRSEEERKHTPGLGRGYVPGVNDGEYRYLDIARNWGAREKQFTLEAAEQLARLREECPAAVLVAERSADLFAPSGGRSPQPGIVQGRKLLHSDREDALATLIVDTLKRSDAQLAQLVASLALDGVAELAARDGGLAPGRGEAWNRGEPGAERIVARRCLERWTLGTTLQRLLTTPVSLAEAVLACALEPECNTVLGIADLVRAYALDRTAKGRSRFHACVALHYQHALEAEIEALRRDAEQFQTLLTVVNWIAAVAAVVAFVASTVVSGGASLPAGAALACALIEGADAILGVAVLALTVVDVAGQLEAARAGSRQALALLSTESVETLRLVGATLATCNALGIDIGEQLVGSLLKLKAARLADALSLRLGLPNRIGLARRALELEWLAGDMGAVVVDGVLVFAAARGNGR